MFSKAPCETMTNNPASSDQDAEFAPDVEEGPPLLASEEGPASVSPPPESVQRQQSISEAVELSGAKFSNAPWFLKWIAFPFQVKDPTNGAKLPEAAGWAMNSAGRGPLNQVGAYVGQAILRAATVDALKNGTGKVYGLKPSSLLTATSSIVGVAAAILMPIVGAIVDHTTHRRMMGVVSGFLAVVLIGIQISINQDNWFFILVIDGFQSFCMLVHLTAVLAYLPDLVFLGGSRGGGPGDQEDGEGILSHYTAHFNIRQFVVQFIYVGLVIVVGEVRNLPPKTLSTSLQTAKDSAGLAFGFGALFLGYSWTFLFRPRPALSKVPDGQNILTTGFVQVHRTSKKIWNGYWALKWFMFSLLWSPEAGAGVLLSITITFLTVEIKLTGIDLAKVSMILMVGNVVGSFLSKWVCRKIYALNSYRLALLMLAISIAVAVVVLDSPSDRNAVFGFAFWWGISMGWMFPSQRVLLCTLIPKGQETEMMGLFIFTGQIIGWLPALLFTIMNENGVSTRWGMGLIPFFCTFAVICTLPMGNYNDAVTWAVRESKDKFGEVIAAAGSSK
jgi:MFS transporter, UMF1 family